MQQPFTLSGEWMWPGSIYDRGPQGAEIALEKACRMGVTDIFLLVKGLNGAVCYRQGSVPLKRSYSDRDVLQEAIDAAHRRGMRVHAWFTSANDAYYKELYPERGLMHFTGVRKTNIIDLSNAEYIRYMEDLTREMVSLYDVDGLHLDYIRYNHLMNGWDQRDLDKLAAMGADTEHLLTLMRRTFTDENRDEDCIFRAYREGNRDTIILAEYRRDNVVRFAQTLIGAARSVRPSLTMTAAMMPDGATSLTDTSFGDLHYGQRFRDASTLFDYILPMAYRRAYDKDDMWIGQVVRNAVAVGNRVLCGLQAYGDGVSAELAADVAAVKKAAHELGEGKVLGTVNFRHGDFHYVHVVKGDHGADVEVMHAIPSQPVKRIEVTLAEGLHCTSASLSGDFCQAEVQLRDDRVTFEADSLLEFDQEGCIHISWTGETEHPPVLVRLWAQEESRAYHVED